MNFKLRHWIVNSLHRLLNLYIPEIIWLPNDIETHPGPSCFCNMYAKGTKTLPHSWPFLKVYKCNFKFLVEFLRKIILSAKELTLGGIVKPNMRRASFKGQSCDVIWSEALRYNFCAELLALTWNETIRSHPIKWVPQEIWHH